MTTLLKDQNISIKTFGCKLNTYDTSFIQKKILEKTQENSQKSFTKLHSKNLNNNQSLNHRHIHILNTCAVTQKATDEAVKWVKNLRKKDSSSLIVVTGCAAQVNTENFLELKEKGADLIIANSHKSELTHLIESFLKNELNEKKVFKSNIFKKETLEEGGGRELYHTRSFLKIQDGCDSFCTFCIIPFARGKSRSLPARTLTQRVNELYDDGVREVVLTGVHIGDYSDKTTSQNLRLENLIEILLKNTKMPRFRCSSLEPIELSPFLIDLYQDERLCPHFHMSIQSTQTPILKRMKRKYTFSDVERSLNTIHKKMRGAFVGMDVIVGFPGEKENDFKDSYKKLNLLPWTQIHVFPYSPRKGTLAFRMKDPLSRSIILKKAKKLRILSKERYYESALRQMSSTKNILFLKKKNKSSLSHNENEKNKLEIGLSRDYWKIKINPHPLNMKTAKKLQDEIQIKVQGIHEDSNFSSSQIYLKGSLL